MDAEGVASMASQGLRLDPPRLGEHTDALLQAVGYDAAQIGQLREDGVVL